MNTWNEINPGHIHQRHLADAVREGIIERGGLPFLFYGVNLCDCVGGGDYVLPSRDLLVNEIELNAKAHHLDAMVLIGTCDKVVPAMLMAAGRVNIPTVIVTGGYMKTPVMDGEYVDFIDIGASISKVKEGTMTPEKFEELIHTCAPCSGACGMMGTANTMSLLTETIGMSLPGNATMAARVRRAHQPQPGGRAEGDGAVGEKHLPPGYHHGIRHYQRHPGLHGHRRLLQHHHPHSGPWPRRPVWTWTAAASTPRPAARCPC